MICERCNALDGRPTKTYKVTKGESVVSRELCQECAAKTAAVYPVAGFVPAEAPEVEAADDAPEAESEETEPEEPAKPSRARGRPKG